eukprot:1152493-Pelagomonas_calceolata.AAC.10
MACRGSCIRKQLQATLHQTPYPWPLVCAPRLETAAVIHMRGGAHSICNDRLHVRALLVASFITTLHSFATEASNDELAVWKKRPPQNRGTTKNYVSSN